jgi:hypothetical protein
MRATGILCLMAAWMAIPSPAPAAESAYFVVVFGSQRSPVKLPRYTHSFATFVHLTPERRLEAFTLSWLPRSGEIRLLRFDAEEGRNYTLEETLRFCDANGMEVACWGPYQIHSDLWNRALWQWRRLQRGEVLYKVYDCGSPDGGVSNCVHALEYVTRPAGQTLPQVVVAPANWGESGSYWVALTLRPWYLEPCRTHDWLLPYLGVNPRALVRYGLACNPTPNPVAQAVQAGVQSPLLQNRVQCGR